MGNTRLGEGGCSEARGRVGRAGRALTTVFLVAAVVACALPAPLTPTSTRTPTSTPTPTPVDWVALGDAALAVGDLEEAVRVYNKALDADPQDPRAVAGLATAFYYQAQYESALRLLRDEGMADLLEREPRAWEIRGRAALALYYYSFSGDVWEGELLEEAADAFEQWSTLVAGAPAPYAYLAWTAWAEGRTSNAGRWLSRAEGFAVDHPAIHIVRALQAEEDEDYVEEVAQGLAAWDLLARKPLGGIEPVFCVRLIGYGYAMQEEYEEAIVWGLRELEVGSARYGANGNLAWWYTQADRCDEAGPYAEQERALYPDNPLPYYVDAVCASRAGDQAAAFAAYREAVLRGIEDVHYWHLDLEGSAAMEGVEVTLTGIDLYATWVKIYSTTDNGNRRTVWMVGVTVEWPGGHQETYVGAEDIELSMGKQEWATALRDVDISPGDLLRITFLFGIPASQDAWVEVVVEVTIPELESGPEDVFAAP